MANEVYMEIPVVEQIAKNFSTYSETLKGVSKVLESTIMVLKTSAFLTMVGGAALERYLSLIKPNVDKMAAKMAELSLDVVGAIKNYQTGDQTGSARFR